MCKVCHADGWSLECVDETDEADDDGNDAQASEVMLPNRATQIYGNMSSLPVVSFEDDEYDEEEEEEKRKMWQTLFVMENYRKYGTPLPLTDGVLSLHNARYD